MSSRDPDEQELEASRTARPQPTDTAETALTRRLGAAARALTDDDLAFDEPPAGVWDRIAAHVDEPVPPTGPDAAGATRTAGEPAPVVPLRPPRHLARRGRPVGWLIGAAAAAVVVVAGAVALIAGDGGDATTVATAQLEPLPDAVPGTESAAASVVQRDGASELDVALDVPAAAGFYEVWLIDQDVQGMVSLGPLRTDGRYQIPAGVDVGAFPIVDVSIEPADGVPTHSGVSVLRGTLA